MIHAGESWSGALGSSPGLAMDSLGELLHLTVPVFHAAKVGMNLPFLFKCFELPY